MDGTNRLRRRGVAACRALCIAAGVAAATGVAAGNTPGLDDLIDRIGLVNVPTGVDITVGQVEANEGNGDYAPDSSNGAFDGKTFILESGPSGPNGHATSVGQNFYGQSSIAPGIAMVHNWSAGDWLANDLRYQTASDPAPLPEGLKVLNNSWIASSTNAAVVHILRRADWIVMRDDVLIVSGENNGSGSENQPLMADGYNGLAVGRVDGNHSSSDTAAGLDGPGRMKPEIVAPAGSTSSATPICSAAAALLVETARTHRDLIDNDHADRSEVIKAVLLAGAERDAAWTNHPMEAGPQRGTTARPLDDVFGTGAVDVNLAHLILTGGEQDAVDGFPDADTITEHGWDLETFDGGVSRNHRFTITETAASVSFLATWHRQVDDDFDGYTMPNVDLFMFRYTDSGSLQPLVGDAGLPYFTGGNVLSNSAVDNIELLHVLGLEPGEYLVQIVRTDSGDPADVALAWVMPAQPDASVPGDLDDDGSVGVSDLLVLLGAWGPCEGCAADLDDNGSVNVSDLLALLSNWG